MDTSTFSFGPNSSSGYQDGAQILRPLGADDSPKHSCAELVATPALGHSGAYSPDAARPETRAEYEFALRPTTLRPTNPLVSQDTASEEWTCLDSSSGMDRDIGFLSKSKLALGAWLLRSVMTTVWNYQRTYIGSYPSGQGSGPMGHVRPCAPTGN